MTDFDAEKIDDELLSAYLDDELTPAERARVDERLASDPAARQLLEELRAVSQEMKSLPAEPLGTDLRGSVLHHAERAMLLSGERGSAGAEDQTSRRAFPIGRSKRAWFWAGAALAAGVMLMILQQRPGKDAALPREVAVRERIDPDRVEDAAPPAMRALDTSESSTVSGEPFAASAPVAESDRTSGLESLRAPASNGAARRVAVSAPRGREFAARDNSDSFRGGGGGALSGGAGVLGNSTLGDLPGMAGRNDFTSMIVNVQCEPEAMQNRTIDAVFAKNQIEVEPPAADKLKENAPQDVDVIVLEAAPAQVYSCIQEISADERNFSAVNVEDGALPTQDPAAKKLASDAKQFNRGMVQNQQQIAVAPSDNRWYYSKNASEQQLGRQLDAAGKLVPQQEGTTTLGVALEDGKVEEARLAKSADDVALRFKSAAPGSATNGPSSGEGAGWPVADESSLFSNYARRASQKLASKDDMLQVMFVLQCPTEQAPAAATAVPATESVAPNKADSSKGIDE